MPLAPETALAEGGGAARGFTLRNASMPLLSGAPACCVSTPRACLRSFTPLSILCRSWLEKEGGEAHQEMPFIIM
jgi:hypothetical protein